MPLSRTSTTARSPSSRLRSVTEPPAGVYFTALDSRLMTACPNRSGSTFTPRYRSLSSVRTEMDFSCASWDVTATQPASTSFSSRSSRPTSTTPLSMRARFSTFSTRRVRRSPLIADDPVGAAALLLGVDVAVLQHLRVGPDGGHRGFQLVGDGGDELRVPVLGLRLAGHVPQREGHAQRAAGVVGEGLGDGPPAHGGGAVRGGGQAELRDAAAGGLAAVVGVLSQVAEGRGPPPATPAGRRRPPGPRPAARRRAGYETRPARRRPSAGRGPARGPTAVPVAAPVCGRGPSGCRPRCGRRRPRRCGRRLRPARRRSAGSAARTARRRRFSASRCVRSAPPRGRPPCRRRRPA